MLTLLFGILALGALPRLEYDRGPRYRGTRLVAHHQGRRRHGLIATALLLSPRSRPPYWGTVEPPELSVQRPWLPAAVAGCQNALYHRNVILPVASDPHPTNGTPPPSGNATFAVTQWRCPPRTPARLKRRHPGRGVASAAACLPQFPTPLNDRICSVRSLSEYVKFVRAVYSTPALQGAHRVPIPLICRARCICLSRVPHRRAHLLKRARL